MESGAPADLGILPHGTGGDLARSLLIPTRLADAARALRGGRSMSIDLGRAVFEDGREKSFVNSASFGLSAEVARRTSSPSGGSYVAEMVRAASRYRCPEVRLTVDAEAERRLRVTTVSLHNGRFFGGGMKMAPEADLADGLLDLVIVKKLPFAKLVRNSPLLYLGGHLRLREVEHQRVRALSARPLDAESEILVEIDGDVEDRLPARFEIRKHALRVRV